MFISKEDKILGLKFVDRKTEHTLKLTSLPNAKSLTIATKNYFTMIKSDRYDIYPTDFRDGLMFYFNYEEEEEEE